MVVAGKALRQPARAHLSNRSDNKVTVSIIAFQAGYSGGRGFTSRQRDPLPQDTSSDKPGAHHLAHRRAQPPHHKARCRLKPPTRRRGATFGFMLYFAFQFSILITMTDALDAATILNFDPDALRAKYRRERDKRIRVDGNQQYLGIEGDFSNYIDDPYAETLESRTALTDAVDVVIIGGGFGGLISGARLKEAGIKSVRIIEKGSDFGGTWYWNRYPGAACDTESYVYLPLCDELGIVPTEKYAQGPEIFAHSQNIARHYDLYQNACLQTQVTGMHWDENLRRWQIETDRGDAMRARFVIMSNGPLNRPKLPGIPGIEQFKGHTFHTSRWDYDYTGGTSNGDLEHLRDQRVGIIGTGASAVQCIPHLGAAAKALYVFQRTPSSIDVRANRPTDPDWERTLTKGWQKARMENFNALTSGRIVEEDLVMDGWTEIIRNLISMVNYRGKGIDPAEIPGLMELADFQKMQQIRARVDDLVDDPITAEALKPYYRQFCKRPCFHDSYLQTFNRASVNLIDTQGQGVAGMTETGVVALGKTYDLDCVIFATGFEVGTEYTRRAGYDLTGAEGLTLSKKWAQGVRTLHGLHSRGFPNVFFMSTAQSGFTTSFPHAMDESAQHMTYIIDRCLSEGIADIQPSQAAEDAWVAEIVQLSRISESFQAECTPGYYNNEGQPNPRSSQNSSYGKGPIPFFSRMKAWREEGSMVGLDCRS
ncbi:MAG: flavin-containing monooxygenase [Pseudomonadales bacterium]